MRELESHRCGGAADKLKIQVTDQIGPGAANHRYVITGYDPAPNPSASFGMGQNVGDNRYGLPILFQHGGIGVGGMNGVTAEALLAIVADRLISFQAGDFACKENAEALHHVSVAMSALHHRTQVRQAQGVEGKLVPHKPVDGGGTVLGAG